jgi:uncharacterized protein YegL
MKVRIALVLLFFLAACPELFGQLQREVTLLQHRDRIRITPMEVLNSPFRETNLSITPDGQYLFFMSLRGGQHWSRWYMMWGADSVYDGDIWYARKVNGSWQPPSCLPYGVNTESGEDEPNVAPNGKKVYYQSWQSFWQYSGGPYYEAEFKGGKWGEAKGLGGGITEFFKTQYDATDGMTLSADGKTFIVACGNDYHNNMDLYISRKGPRGWSYCRRLGISTPRNERSAFLAADGRTLYFASDGYGGYGGLDIFKTTMNPDGTFGEVINLGKPFNTAGNDYGFILTGDGNEGYFVRNGDIYFADLTDADPRMKPQYQISLKGTVRDSLSKKPIPATVLLMDARTKRIMKKVSTDEKGNYALTLPNEDAIYDQVVLADKRTYKAKKERLKTKEVSGLQVFEFDFLLAPKNPPAPVIAEARPEPAKKPEPDPKPAPPPEPEPSRKPPMSGLSQVDPLAPGEVAPPTENPAQLNVEERENPYSFDGIAENNLILLMDVSASMKQADRLPLLKDAFQRLLMHMRAVDRVSIITYSSEVEVLVDGVSAAQQVTISDAIDGLSGGGGTNIKGALRKAFKTAEDNFIAGGNNRIILATDGYFEDVDDLYALVERNHEGKYALSVFTFGKMGDARKEIFDKLAGKGLGNHTNITRENIDQALLKEAKAVRKK